MKAIQLDPEYIFKHQVQIIEQDLPLIVENGKKVRRTIQKSRLREFLSHPGILDKYKFYISEDNINLWRRICTTRYNFPVDDKVGSVPNLDGSKLIAELKKVSETSLKERIDLLSHNHNELNNMLLLKKGEIDRETAEHVFPISKSATMMAGVAMSDRKKINGGTPPELGIVVQKSSETILAISEAIGKNTDTLKQFSQTPDFRKSDTLAHCCRVFHMYSDLLYYYHNIVNNKDNRKELIESIENKCDEYYHFYHSFIPHKRMTKVGDVFEGSLPFLNKEEINSLSLAAAYHDLGKIVQLDYYESAKPRDDRIIEQHPFEIFEMLNLISENQNIALTASMHHEMYGGGYGPYASLGGTYFSVHPEESIEYVITNDIKPVLEDKKQYIPGYFPAKFLEICDVFDALHNKRGYKTSKPVSSVLSIMGEDFFNPDRLKTTVEELEELCYGKMHWNRYFIKDLDSSLYSIKPYAKHTVAHDIETLFPKVKPYIGQGKNLRSLPKKIKSTIINYQTLLRMQNKIIRNPGMLDPILFDIFIDYISRIEEIDYSRFKYTVA
jgi:HD-GYP domain-containing protein (c-di-GMP phosphodiesterase class II)